MSGQPGIYKMDKALFYGVKDLVQKIPYSWWPPQEYKLYQLGRFDLYPLASASLTRDQIFSKLKKTGITNEFKVSKTNLGCFHIQYLLSLIEQQTILDSIRSQCIEGDPQKYKFSRSEVLAEDEEQMRQEDTFEYLDNSGGRSTKNRNAKKHGCYVMNLNGRDISESLKAIPLSVEEGVNKMQGSSSGGVHSKSVYKRYTFDFFKKGSDPDSDAYSDKISLNLMQGGKEAKKKSSKGLLINAFIISIG